MGGFLSVIRNGHLYALVLLIWLFTPFLAPVLLTNDMNPPVRYAIGLVLKMSAILFAVVVVFAFFVCSVAQINGFNYRFDEWQSRAIRFTALANSDTSTHISELPYGREDVIVQIIKSNKVMDEGLHRFYLKRLSSDIAFLSGIKNPSTYFELNWRNFPSFSKNINPKDQIRLESDVEGYTKIRQNLSVYFDFQFDTDGALDSDYHGRREWKGVTADMRAAYFQYTSKKWSLLLGRDFVHWGPGSTGSLLTSGYAPALDMIKLTFDLGHFRFQGFDALLIRGDKYEDEKKINRYFSGHRLSLRIPDIEFGVHETVIYGGPREIVRSGFLNPLIPYYFTDVMQGEDPKANVTWSFDAAFYRPKGMRFYGQFLVDEYYYEKEHYPNRTAMLFGIDCNRVPGWNRIGLNIEYVRIDRWVYNYETNISWNRLNYLNSIFGHPIGPDADLYHIEWEFYIGWNSLIRATYEYSRKGETTIDTPLNTDEQLEQNHPPFPFGIPEKRSLIDFQLEYAPNASFLFLLNFRDIIQRDSEHIKGKSVHTFTFRVGFMHNLRQVFNTSMEE
jgi:hypothetical protein